MIANLKLHNNGKYYCSNCMMRQPYILIRCYFCDAIFTNYEEIVLKQSTEDLPYENDIQNNTI